MDINTSFQLFSLELRKFCFATSGKKKCGMGKRAVFKTVLRTSVLSTTTTYAYKRNINKTHDMTMRYYVFQFVKKRALLVDILDCLRPQNVLISRQVLQSLDIVQSLQNGRTANKLMSSNYVYDGYFNASFQSCFPHRRKYIKKMSSTWSQHKHGINGSEKKRYGPNLFQSLLIQSVFISIIQKKKILIRHKTWK